MGQPWVAAESTMSLSLLPLHGQKAGLDQQQPALNQTRSKVQVRRDLLGSMLAEDTALLHGDVSSEPPSRIRNASCCHAGTIKCSQECDSVYYHKISPRVTRKTKPMLKDGCIFSFFKPRPLKAPSTMTEKISACRDVGAGTAEETKLEENTGKLLLANSSTLETVASNATPADCNEDLVETVALRKSEPCVHRGEHDHGVNRWKEGMQLPTSDPNSEDNVRVRKSLANNLFIPHLEGNEPSHLLLCPKQQVEASKSGQAMKVYEAPAEGPITESSSTPMLSSAARPTSRQPGTADHGGILQDDKRQDRARNVVGRPPGNKIASIESGDWQKWENSKFGSSSQTKSGSAIFGNISTEAAKKLAPLKPVPNLTKPDLSWVPETPVSFTSSSCTSSKGSLTPPQSAGLPEDVINQASNTIKVAQPALNFGKSGFKYEFDPASMGLKDLQSFSSSSSPVDLILTPSADSREDSPKKAGVVNKYPKNLPEPEIPLQSQDREQPADRAWSHLVSSSDETNPAQAQQLRLRVEAAVLKEQIKRAFEAKRAGEIQETTVPKAGREKKGIHKRVAASKISDPKIERQAARAQRESTMALFAAVEHQARQKGNPADHEFSFQTGPTNREKRAQAFKQSQAKKMEEQVAAKERKYVEQERKLAMEAAAPVLSVAAKRRSRAKRNAAGKSWADVART